MEYYISDRENGTPFTLDSRINGHVLIGGASGSGKSVLLNNIITGLVNSNDNCSLYLVDFKMVEFHKYENANHVACEVISDIEKFELLLSCAITTMEKRYKKMLDADATNYTEIGETPAYIIIDELGDIMLQYKKRIQNSLARLLQKSRASGIIFIVATQRPEASILPPIIRCNFMTSIATRTRTARESALILDFNGAEKLRIGECLLVTAGVFEPVKLYVPFLSNDEVKRRIKK